MTKAAVCSDYVCLSVSCLRPHKILKCNSYLLNVSLSVCLSVRPNVKLRLPLDGFSFEPSSRGLAQGRRYAEAMFLEFSLSFLSFQGCRLTIGCRGSERLWAICCTRFLITLRTGDADLRFYITTVQDG